MIATSFIERYSAVLNKMVRGIDEDFWRYLERYEWPGNIRELQNTIEYVMNMMPYSGMLEGSLLPGKFFQTNGTVRVEEAIEDLNLENMERQMIKRALAIYGVSPEAELLVRWIQNGIFQPRFSIHSTNIDNTVTEPWMYSNCTEYIRTAIKFRYRLFPYLYSLMERAHETGLPIMEPMCSAFQNDPKCYEEGIDFMFGDSLLVANVVEKGATTRKIYLPEGNKFYDFYTRTPYDGGQTIEIPVDLGSIPLFVKGGSIIPMATNQMKNLMTEQPNGISILCAPDCDGSFVLYEDDGVSMDYEKGCYLKTFISMAAGERTVLTFKQEGSYTTSVETMSLDMIHREKAPYWITVDNQEIPHFLHRRKFEEAECGWYYSQTLKSVQVKYLNPKKDHQVVVSFEQFDLIGM